MDSHNMFYSFYMNKTFKKKHIERHSNRANNHQQQKTFSKAESELQQMTRKKNQGM